MQHLTSAQEEYFKNSKMRDANNNLKTCWHFTDKDFDTFDLDKIGSSSGDYGYFGKGIYFTSSEGWGTSFGKNKLECYLNIENPLIIEELDRWDKENLLEYLRDHHPDYGDDYGPKLIAIEDDDGYYDMEDYDDYITVDNLIYSDIHHGCLMDYAEQITDWAKLKGYDAILSDWNEWAGITEIVVFYPHQIKSINNFYPTCDDNFRDNSREYFRKHPDKQNTLDNMIDRAKEKVSKTVRNDFGEMQERTKKERMKGAPDRVRPPLI